MLPLVAVIVAADAWVSALLFSAAAAISCWEYYRLVFGAVPFAALTGLAYAAAIPLVPAFAPPDQVGALLFAVVPVASMLTWSICLFAGPRSVAPERAGHIMAGLLFCSVGLAALSSLRAGRDGIAWTTVVLAATWTNDTAVYLVGRAFGRHKLYAAVSPGKTWEGFLGGLCGGILALLLIRPFLPRYLDVTACFALGTLAGLLGPLGDLCKSMLKRAYQVKDTGTLFPGHGGMLDRIDAVLFVAPPCGSSAWSSSLIKASAWPAGGMGGAPLFRHGRRNDTWTGRQFSAHASSEDRGGGPSGALPRARTARTSASINRASVDL